MVRPYWKIILSFFLVLGMIAQAAAVVRHGSMMLGSGQVQSQANVTSSPLAALEADLKAAFCHSGSEGATGGDPSRNMNDCPVCTGLVCAFTLPAPQQWTNVDFQGLGVVPFPPADQRVERQRFIRPASRGPPTSV
jgi:hypothetical protein